MKVGDYVRFKFNGEIGKVSYYEYDDTYENGHCIHINNEKNGYMLTDEEFVSSPNIIDLIEKKDIIKYHFNGFDYISEVFEYKNDLWVQNEDNMFEISEINIKSIVTKEQFESMEYKIGE